MDCTEARLELHDLRRGRLPPELATSVRLHLDGCQPCRQAEAAEGALDQLLLERLPHHPAPERLRRRLAQDAAALASPPGRAPAGQGAGLARSLGPALAAGLLLGALGLVAGRQLPRGDGDGSRAPAEAATLARLEDEAIADHLRVLVSQRPVEVESGGPHQVKPWFEGRLDFAPAVPLPEVADLRLRGGAVGWVLDRKAAVLQYSLRLHAVTLLAFRADGLAWPPAPPDGPALAERRGFAVSLWRTGGVGYALVSDVPPAELRELARTMAAATVR